MRNKNKNKNKNLLAYSIIFILIAVIMYIVYAFVSISSNVIPRDKETLCRIDGNYSKHVILLDVTDRYSLIQYKAIRNKIAEISDSLNVDEKLQFYLISNTVNSGAKPIFEVCNPGKGNDASSVFSNPKMMLKKWEDKLYKPVNAILEKFNNSSPANHSPILETMQLINNISFRQKDRVEGQKQKFTIISDFIQNSKDYSFYSNYIDRFWKSNYKYKIETNFTNTDIELFFVRKDGNEQFITKKYTDFWKDFLTRMKAKSIKISRIEG